MHSHLIARLSGLFAIIFSSSLLIPILVALWYDEPETSSFLVPLAGGLGIGLTLWAFGMKAGVEVSNRDGFLIVTIFWILLSALGAWPLVLSTELSLVDAVFESVSGFTTTGATVMTGLDQMPKSVLFYRQQLQWLGGMGLIVLGIAVLPVLGIGGMQLYRAEAPGPMKEDKLTPRLASTARALWIIYVGLTLACAFSYWMAGMTPFDAIAHSLSTVSTGGFSTHDQSIAYFDSAAIEGVAILFMLFAAINFSIHFVVWHKRNPLAYLRDVEVRSFLFFVMAVVLLVGVILRWEGDYASLPSSLRDATFEVVSVVTSTGFGTVDFSHWPDFLPFLMIMISFVGGCGGSTAGGIKVMRVLLLVQQGVHEVLRLIHPHAVLLVRVGRRIIQPRLMQAVWGFFALYLTTFGILMILMMHAGLDQVSAFSAVATSMNNLGPGLGEVAYNFQSVSDMGKLVAVVAMLLGRLEILTILVLLSPHFWKR
jgi:trk system potassium uptake protein TrkH